MIFKGVKACLPNCRKKPPDICVNGVKIPFQNKVKYLGLVLDAKLSYIPHIDHILDKARSAYLTWFNVLHHPDLSVPVKVTIYKTIIRSIISYGFPIWYNLSKHQLNRLYLFERKCLREATNNKKFRTGPSGEIKMIPNEVIYNTANMTPLADFLYKIGNKALLRLALTDNKLIEEIFNTPSGPNRTAYKSIKEFDKYWLPHTDHPT